ncbi:MAG: hypothetical protein R3F61_33425 [Myxococcota bacterium]
MRPLILGISLSTVLFAACKSDGPDADDADADTDVDADTDTDSDTDIDTDSEPGPPWDLTLVGQGYGGGNGQTVRVRLADEELVLVEELTATIVGGGWQVRFRDQLDPNEPGYWVGWWIDLTGNGECGAGDAAFLERIATRDEDIIRVHNYSEAGIDRRACNGF